MSNIRGTTETSTPSSWQRWIRRLTRASATEENATIRFLHAGALDGLVEIVDRAEHRHVAAADLGDRARVLVEEADRRQPVLGVALQAPRDLRADDAGAHDQHRLAHQTPGARPALGEGQRDPPEPDADQREHPGTHANPTGSAPGR